MISLAISIYLAIGALVAAVFLWVHYSAPLDELVDLAFHIRVRQHIVLVTCALVMFWVGLAVQIVAAQIRRLVQ